MNKTITRLTLFILVVSSLCSLIGIITSTGAQSYPFQAITGEIVSIYGTGLYAHDSLSMVAQGLASDWVTLVLAIPLTLWALIKASSLFKAKLILVGLLGYFLYTYTSYAFLWNYNPLFIGYVVIMSLSFFALILSLMSFDLSTLCLKFVPNLKTGIIIGFQGFVGLMICLLWLRKLAPTWFSSLPPVGLEHYTTLVIQALDLGLIVPTVILSAWLLHRRSPWGLLLSSIMILKGIALLTSISAMAISMLLSGVQTSWIELAIFGFLDLFGVLALWRLLSQLQPSTPSSSN